MLEVTAKKYFDFFFSPLCWFCRAGGSRNVNILCQKMEDKVILAHMW